MSRWPHGTFERGLGPSRPTGGANEDAFVARDVGGASYLYVEWIRGNNQDGLPDSNHEPSVNERANVPPLARCVTRSTRRWQRTTPCRFGTAAAAAAVRPCGSLIFRALAFLAACGHGPNLVLNPLGSTSAVGQAGDAARSSLESRSAELLHRKPAARRQVERSDERPGAPPKSLSRPVSPDRAVARRTPRRSDRVVDLARSRDVSFALRRELR
ncbi:unnamed protein product [Lampetra planeri]